MECHYRINIFYSESDGAYVAEIPELNGCSAFGHSPEEALDEVLIAQELWLQASPHQKVVCLDSEGSELLVSRVLAGPSKVVSGPRV
jgi:predicted RNase H-like HicB family nuclease